ncbi:unnamed protein product, partial [Rangifer tarandus platyrhynchus]
MAARWPTRRLVSFPTQSTPPPEDAKDFGGADVICAYSRQAERVPQNPGRRWCLLSAPPPWFQAQRIGPASIAESAGAEGKQRGLWGGQGRDAPRSCRSSGGSWSLLAAMYLYTFTELE